jgi:predicted Zn-dependent protease
LTRLKRPDDALIEFHSASDLEPTEPRFQYVYAIALHSAGRPNEAIALLKQAVQSHPANPDILTALISFNRLAGDARAALGYAEQLAAITPGDQGLAALIQELRRAVKSPAQ